MISKLIRVMFQDKRTGNEEITNIEDGLRLMNLGFFINKMKYEERLTKKISLNL